MPVLLIISSLVSGCSLHQPLTFMSQLHGEGLPARKVPTEWWQSMAHDTEERQKAKQL